MLALIAEYESELFAVRFGKEFDVGCCPLGIGIENDIADYFLQNQVQVHLERHVKSQFIADLFDELVDALQFVYLVF
jgi:hypothetical protein